jgi:dipeptidyl aminopeptidase/acylaminoacyl peptidase
MTLKIYFLHACLVALAVLAGCATAPSHPGLAGQAMPELIPVRDFVASTRSTGGHSVSPDGKKLAWFGADGISAAIWVKSITPEHGLGGGENDAKSFVIQARYYRWSADSEYLFIVADAGGDEDAHVHVGQVNGNSKVLTDLTPYAKTNSHVLRAVSGSADVIITSNRRDKKVFDLYRVSPANGKSELLATNPGNVAWWGVDKKGQLRSRMVLEGDSSLLQLPSPQQTDPWITTARASRFDSLHFLEFDDDGKSAWALSNRSRDKQALVRVNLQTGAETVEFAVDDVDLESVRLKQKNTIPLTASSLPGYPRLEVFDPTLRARLAALTGGKPADVQITSIDDNERQMTVFVGTDKGGKTYLLRSDSSLPEPLGEGAMNRMAHLLADTRPVAFTSRDGLTLNGYLTLPVSVAPRKLPMVLLVHGGPWARDRWSAGNTNRSMQQFLANRGYAVLQVNYRGSTGYGKAFLEKAVGEFAGKMHDDLIDGVDWAVKTGLADPERVAIYGASYGGYAAMVGATFTPDVFACAVNIVGVTHLARLIETAPAYWELGKPWWTRYVGDPANPQQRAIMDAKSPLFKANQVKKPVLIMHGVNDARVKLEQSDLMVAALQKAGKQVDYVTFKGDGHGNQKWNNNLTMYRKTEDFLATCLGGRTSGFDYYQLASWMF